MLSSILNTIWAHYLINGRILIGFQGNDADIYTLRKPIELAMQRQGDRVQVGFQPPCLPLELPKDSILKLNPNAVSHSIEIDESNQQLKSQYLQHATGLITPNIAIENIMNGGRY